MAKVYVDGKPYDMDPNQNLLHGCLTLGFNLPYFCWHPALGSVGACRQCAVKQFKDENDTKGRIVMACMTPATEGTRISIEDPEAVKFRASVIEGLMLNHPHDCPVCDEGGECHLQDMTVMTGHDYRRYPYEKRTFRNQDLGPLVNHEMNRCIQCYRCVRYYQEYAGGHDLQAFVSRNIVFFGRHEDGVLESEFAGNLVEICPTGVFTDKTLKNHYTRKWDLQMAPTICVHCGLGCNVSAGERYGTLRRIVNRYNSEVNGYFLCDRGRFGYEFVNSDRRLHTPLFRGERIPRQEAKAHLDSLLSGSATAIGIGSPRASLEANFALRHLVGPDRFFAGIADEEYCLVSLMLEILKTFPVRSPSLQDIEHSDAVLILGEDVTNVAPRMALALRQSVRQQPMQIAEKLRIPLWMDHGVRDAMQKDIGPLFAATPYPTRLDDVTTETYRAAPDDIARLGFAVAHALDESAPAPPDLPEEVRTLAGRIAQSLKGAQHPLVITGPGCRSDAVIQSAANVARALAGQAGEPASLSFVTPQCNSFGLAMLGARSLGAAFQAAREGHTDTAVILENDLYRRAPAEAVDAFLGAVRHVVVVDQLFTPTAEKAELVLPTGTFAESNGTLVSSEGRAQRFFQVFQPNEEIQDGWRWLGDPLWQTLDSVIGAAAEALPAIAKVPEAAPSSAFRMAGSKIPRAPHRYSGRTAMLANVSVDEPKPPDDPDSPLSFTMEGTPDQPPSPLIPFFWSPGWNSIQSTNKFQSEIAGPLRGGDPGVRLIEPSQQPNGSYYGVVPPAFEPHSGDWFVVPIHHIFGSEELSALAPGIAALAPKPYIVLHPDDARKLEVEAGDEVTVMGKQLPVQLAPELPRGVVGLPSTLTSLPAWTQILRTP